MGYGAGGLGVLEAPVMVTRAGQERRVPGVVPALRGQEGDGVTPRGPAGTPPPPQFRPVGSGSRPGADALRPANPRHAAWTPWPSGREVGQGLVRGWVGGIGCSPPTPGGQGPPPGVPRCPVAPGHRPRPMWDLLQAEVNPQPVPPPAALSHRPPEGGVVRPPRCGAGDLGVPCARSGAWLYPASEEPGFNLGCRY